MLFNQIQVLWLQTLLIVFAFSVTAFQLPSESKSNLNNNANNAFLARLHRQLSQPIESMPDFDPNPINQGSQSIPDPNLSLWKQIRQRQKQLQRLQTYFGSELNEPADAIDQAIPSSYHKTAFDQLPLDQLSASAQIETVGHLFQPKAHYKTSEEPIDELRKYHFLSDSDSSPSFGGPRSLSSPAQEPNAFDQLLQEIENEKQASISSGYGNQGQDENAIKSKLAQLFGRNSAPEPTDEQLAAALRHAPLEAILAQTQEDNQQQQAMLQRQLDSMASAMQSNRLSKQSREASRNLLQNLHSKMSADSVQQMPMKKQAEISQDSQAEPLPVIDAVADKGPERAEQPQHFKTQLKKVEISQQDGKQLRKEESYEQSVQVSPVNKNTPQSITDNGSHGSAAVHESGEPSHMEQSAYQVNSPIAVQLRNSPSGSGQLVTRSLTSKITSFGDMYFLMLVIGCSMASIMSVVGAGVCFYRFQQHHKATADVDYPAYGVIGPVSKPPISPGAQQPLQVDLKGGKSDNRKTIEGSTGNVEAGETAVGTTTSAEDQSGEVPNGDRKLAQSAQMYHYQHQKQQMIASEKNNNGRNTSTSDAESEEENEEGDYTVYECPGLASTGEIEVTNPLFQHSP